MAYDALKDEADFLRRAHGPDPSLSATLGSADAILVAVYLGGKVWRRFYGPLGPERSLDEYLTSSVRLLTVMISLLLISKGGF